MPITRQCEYCGKPFQTYPSAIKNGYGRFCSRACGASKPPIVRTCAHCGKQFHVRPSNAARHGGKYCSLQCRRATNTKRCQTCGASFTVGAHNKQEKDRRFCSQPCAKKAHGRQFRDNGDGTWSIELTKGKTALIDEADLPLVVGLSWQVQRGHNTFYAKTKLPDSGEEALLHRLIMNPPPGLYPDHIDRNGLNNRRSNLRLATNSQNLMNRSIKKQPDATSRYRGVSKASDGSGRWVARIANTYIGRFATEEEASDAYREAAESRFGPFAAIAIKE